MNLIRKGNITLTIITLALLFHHNLTNTMFNSTDITKKLLHLQSEHQENEKKFHVRIGNTISPQERSYIEKKQLLVHDALEILLNRPIKKESTPTTAIVASGGGYRAMLCYIGFIRGLQKISDQDKQVNIWDDLISRTVTLSGSTWAESTRIISQLPLKKYADYITTCIEKPLHQATPEEKKQIKRLLKTKKQNNQPITLADIYGGLLANRLLDIKNTEKQNILLSDQAPIIENGTGPYPIYTAISGDTQEYENPSFYTDTPHEISNLDHQTHIPTKAFGCTFNNGISTNTAPEQSLGLHDGKWGSAFAANIHDALKAEGQHLPHLELIEKLLKPIESKRILPFYSKTPNYMFGMPNQPLAEHKNIKQVDAGLRVNLPFFPISGGERKAHIIFVVDSSAGTIGDELRKYEDYAHKNNLPFPPINYDNIDKKTISIFKDKEDQEVPMVIYMPRISDQNLWNTKKTEKNFAKYNLEGFDLDYVTNNDWAQTQHFQYAQENSTKIINQMTFNVLANQKKILKALNWFIDKKQQS